MGNMSSGQQVSCTVCSKSAQGKKLSCGHAFHASCIDAWLSDKGNCPVCRRTFSSAVDTSPTDVKECPICLDYIAGLRTLSCGHGFHAACLTGKTSCPECGATFQEIVIPRCAFCSEQYISEEVKLSCGHSFHEPCVSSWIEEANSCPECSLPVDPSKPSKSPEKCAICSEKIIVKVKYLLCGHKSHDTCTVSGGIEMCVECLSFSRTLEELRLVSLCLFCGKDLTGECLRLPCGHNFHKQCSSSWIEEQKVCPDCLAPYSPPQAANTVSSASSFEPAVPTRPTGASIISPHITPRSFPLSSASAISPTGHVALPPAALASNGQNPANSSNIVQPPRRFLAQLPRIPPTQSPNIQANSINHIQNFNPVPLGSFSNAEAVSMPSHVPPSLDNITYRSSGRPPLLSTPATINPVPPQYRNHYGPNRSMDPAYYPGPYFQRDQVYNSSNHFMGTPLYSSGLHLPHNRPSCLSVSTATIETMADVAERPHVFLPSDADTRALSSTDPDNRQESPRGANHSCTLPPANSPEHSNTSSQDASKNNDKEVEGMSSRRSRTITSSDVREKSRSKSRHRNRPKLSLVEMSNQSTCEMARDEPRSRTPTSHPRNNLREHKSSSKSMTNLNAGAPSVGRNKRASRRQSPSACCSLCSSVLTDKSIDLSCGHSFHDFCILPSLKDDKPCPACDEACLSEGESSTSEDETEALRKEIEQLRLKDKLREKRLEQIEETHRKKNLIFKGIRSYGPNSYREVICHFCSEVLGVNVDSLVEAVLPIGRKRPDNPTLKVVFNSSQSATEVLSKCSRLRGTEFSVSRDYSQVVRQRRNKLLHCRYEIMQKTNLKCVSVRDEVLFVDNRKFIWDEEEGLVAKEDKKDETFLRKLIGSESWMQLKTFCKT